MAAPAEDAAARPVRRRNEQVGDGGQGQDGRRRWWWRWSGWSATPSTARPSSAPPPSWPTTRRAPSRATPCASWRPARSASTSAGGWRRSWARARAGRRHRRRRPGLGGAAMIQMRTILEVADNSGARKISMHPAPGRVHRPLRRPGRRHHRQREGVRPRRPRGGEEGQGREGGHRALRQGAPAPRRLLHPLRPQRGRAHQRRRASRWARACSARWRASCATRSS